MKKIRLKHLIDSRDINKTLIYDFINSADEIRNGEKFIDHKGKIVSALFFEPSTRTKLSFDVAMSKLGGRFVLVDLENSSLKKKESLEDTLVVTSLYSDVLVLRHFNNEIYEASKERIKIPIINAGNGSNQHPTQALVDIYTMYREFKRIENLNIAVVGDLKYSRVFNSLCYLLANFESTTLTFVSKENLKASDEIKNYLTDKNLLFKETKDFKGELSKNDIIYMLRPQKERHKNIEINVNYEINEKNLSEIPKTSRIFHALPKNEEINLDYKTEQNDERVAYFRQAENGLYMRMAILDYFLKY